jgi:cytochrome c-type biogenesis protein CcmE
MNKKYIIIGGIVVAFTILAIFSFDSGKIEYSDFATAKKNEKVVQIIGKASKDMPVDYDEKNNKLTFLLVDEKNQSAPIEYNGPKPNNFDIAPMVVVKGKFENNKFVANEILTKCPSKYESKFEDVKKQGI